MARSPVQNGEIAQISERILGRWAGIILGVIALAAVSGAGWVIASTVAIQRKVAVIEANRFTNKDGMAMEDRIMRRVDERLSRIEKKLDKLDDTIKGLIQ